jgi:hypothetical protein
MCKTPGFEPKVMDSMQDKLSEILVFLLQMLTNLKVHENSVPAVQGPDVYAETEHHLPQGNCGVFNSTVHWLDPSMQLSSDNGCASFGPVPAYPFPGMDSTARGLEWDLMASSTSNDSSTQPAKSNIPIGSEKNASKERPLKTVTFRKYKYRSRRTLQRSPPYIGASLGKRVRLGVSTLDRGILLQNRTVNDGSAEPMITDPHHVEQQHALALLKNSFRPSSAFSAQKFADLIVQIEQLVIDNEKYVDPAIPTAGTTLTSTVSSTRDSYSNSGVMDSGCPTDDTSVSSTPFPEKLTMHKNLPPLKHQLKESIATVANVVSGHYSTAPARTVVILLISARTGRGMKKEKSTGLKNALCA